MPRECHRLLNGRVVTRPRSASAGIGSVAALRTSTAPEACQFSRAVAAGRPWSSGGEPTSLGDHREHVPGKDDARVGCVGRRRVGRHRRDPLGIGEHRDQRGSIQAGSRSASSTSRAPASHDNRQTAAGLRRAARVGRAR
jgi:hypothetical protein